MKPFTALAYNGRFPEFECKGAQDRCWSKRGHGRLNFTEALAQSCNSYFLQLAASKSIPMRLRLIAAKYQIAAPAVQSPDTRIGLGTGWQISPLALTRAYAELSLRGGEPAVAQILEGLDASARTGTSVGHRRRCYRQNRHRSMYRENASRWRWLYARARTGRRSSHGSIGAGPQRAGSGGGQDRRPASEHHRGLENNARSGNHSRKRVQPVSSHFIHRPRGARNCNCCPDPTRVKGSGRRAVSHAQRSLARHRPQRRASEFRAEHSQAASFASFAEPWKSEKKATICWPWSQWTSKPPLHPSSKAKLPAQHLKPATLKPSRHAPI